MNSDTLIAMMLAPILIKMAEQFIQWLTRNVVNKYEKSARRFSRASMTLKSTEDSMYGTGKSDRNVMKIISNVVSRLERKNCEFHSTELRYASDMFCKFPLETVLYKGFEFKFHVETFNNGHSGANNNASKETSVVIYHRDSKKIRAFINKCIKEVDNENDLSYKQIYYGQTKTKDGNTVYRSFPYTPDLNFDDIFFPQKQQIIAAVDDVMSGKTHKLSLYLHGEPGCGKSSLVKAIAAKTGYSLVEIKLSFIENDDELKKIIFGKKIHALNDDQPDYLEVANSRRIYLFEDIDAECDIVYKRENSIEKRNDAEIHRPAEKKSTSDDAAEKSDVPVTKTQKLTLQGILNVLDGAIPLTGIIVITTNHPEKLDPALIRFGRVTHNIKMERLTSECAGMLVKKFHPEWDGTISGGLFTPAELEAICQTNSLEDVNRLISA